MVTTPWARVARKASFRRSMTYAVFHAPARDEREASTSSTRTTATRLLPACTTRPSERSVRQRGRWEREEYRPEDIFTRTLRSRRWVGTTSPSKRSASRVIAPHSTTLRATVREQHSHLESRAPKQSASIPQQTVLSS